jgi:ABC-type Fe3+-hydroxamate transport system substrate-binding protein
MPVFTDQLGNKINLPHTPERIISLVPSQTELLFDLGLENEVVGITKFCIHPHQWFETKTRIGGTKNLNIELIHQLKPDLLIANKEENTKDQVEVLSAFYPVWVSDVNNLQDALQMIQMVGDITGTSIKAMQLVSEINNEFNKTAHNPSPPTAAYLIWKDPYMVAGGDTFINAMLQAAGFKNAFQNLSRYPQASVSDLQNAGCDYILLSSEPYPFKQKHLQQLQAEIPDTKIILVDGEMFSWYGSRLLKAPAYFKRLWQQML